MDAIPRDTANLASAATGAAVDIRDWLRDHPGRSPAELVDVLQRDQLHRWGRGERIPAEAYLQLLAKSAGATADDDDQSLDLIYAEFLLRRQSGESPSLAEYEWRFPHHGNRLGLLIDLEDRLETEAPTDRDRADDLCTDNWQRTTPNAERSSVPYVRGYEILEEVGRGGMGVVYKARQIALNRTVAVKVIPAANAEARARFRIEVEAVARLQHPNIVQIYEVGKADDGRDGCPYMALEFVDGGSLAQRLQGEPLPVRTAAELVETLARAVHFAHPRGILHRDLKPANILLGKSSSSQVVTSSSRKAGSRPDDLRLENSMTPKVADFGLAKLLEEADAAQTRTGDILGTPCYMAPEQAAGNSHDIGTPTDVHALGAILYEALTGSPPFRGDNSFATMEQVRFHEPPPPGRLRTGVPRDLDTICSKCLRKEPAQRYASAEELADDLRRYLNGKPIRARRTGLLGRASRWCRRNPALAVTLAVAAVAIAAVASVGSFRVLEERERYRTERDVAQANLYRALLGEARAQMKARDTGWWWLAMENLRDAGRLRVPNRDAVELRELAIECMGSEYPCFRLHDTWSGHDGPVTALACRPDGRLVASGSKDTTVRLWSLPEGHAGAVFKGHTSTIIGLAFAPDGQTLASCSTDGTVRFWNPDRPDVPPRVHDFQAGPVRGIAFAPDGRWLAAACGNGTVRLLPLAGEPDMPDGRTAMTLTGHAEAVTCLVFSGTGELASGGKDKTIRFWDIAAQKQTQSWPVANVPTCVVYDRGGKIVAWGDGESRGMQARGRDEGRIALPNGPHANGVTQVGHYKENLWWTASTDGTLKLWHHYNSSLAEVAVARGDFSAVLATALTPTRDRVIVGYRDGRIRSWELATPPQQRRHYVWSHNAVLVGSDRRLVDRTHVTDLAAVGESATREYAPSGVRGLVVHPTNPTLAIGRDDGTIETWDRSDRRELSRWQAHERSITALAGSPDGERLASASHDGTVKLWQGNPHRLQRTLDPRIGALHAVVWSRDGRTLAASGERGVVEWDLDNLDAPRRRSERSLVVSAVALGSSALAYSEADGAIDVRDRTTGLIVQQLMGHTAAVAMLAFSPDGQRLASSAGDGTVRIWDVATGREMIQIPQQYTVTSLAFHPDGRYLAIAHVVYDLRLQKESTALHGVPRPWSARFTPDGSALLLGTRGGAVLTCSMAEIERAHTVANGTTGGVATSGSVRVDVTTTVVPGGHTDTTWGIAVSPDGRWVATASHDRTVKLWDAATMRLVRTLEGHIALVWSVAFSPDSRFLASGSVDIRIWNVETGRQVHRFEGGDKLVSSLAYHPSRPWLASSCYDGSIRLWDVATGRPLGTVHQFGTSAHGVAFRPDGRWLVATDDTRIALWPIGDEPPTGPPERRVAGPPATIWSVAFSPNGQYLVAGSERGHVALWDGSSFERLVALRSGTGQIRGLAFSRDGELLAAAGYTVPTVVWDLPKLRRTLQEMDLDW